MEVYLMRLTLAEPMSETWAERRLPAPDGRDVDSDRRAGLAFPLSTAEAQGIALTEALAWAGVALWGGGLAWLVVSDLADRWSRHQSARRDDHQGGVRAHGDAR
jgi:hypothetical protein